MRQRVNTTAITSQLAAALLALVSSSGAQSQSYPSKPLRVITQFAAGSGGDAGLRVATAAIGEVMGQPVVIENRAGAGGVLAAEAVARSVPDGYTLLAATPSTQVMRVYMAKVSFDPVRDFQPVSQITTSAALIIANPAFPANTIRELVDYAKKNPGKVSFGTSGIGTEHHLSAEQILMLTGTKMVHVPYKAGAQAMLDVAAGQLPISFSIPGPVYPLLKAGKVKVLGVVGEKRSAVLPEVETVGEAVPGFVPVQGWTGLFTAAGLPQPILRRLGSDVVKAMARPEVRAKMSDIGSDALGNTPEEFAANLREQVELVGRILKTAGIKLAD